jgi:hypothetical protein
MKLDVRNLWIKITWNVFVTAIKMSQLIWGGSLTFVQRKSFSWVRFDFAAGWVSECAWRLHNWKICLCTQDIEAILEFTGAWGMIQYMAYMNIKAHKKEPNVHIYKQHLQSCWLILCSLGHLDIFLARTITTVIGGGDFKLYEYFFLICCLGR